MTSEITAAAILEADEESEDKMSVKLLSNGNETQKDVKID